MKQLIFDTAEVYTTGDAAKLIGVHFTTLYRWIKEGKVIPLKLSNRTVITQSEVDRIKALNLE